jgi:Eukaryotic aspartyl protease
MMRSFLNTLILLTLLAAYVASSPTRVEKRSFKVERVRNGRFAGHNGPRALLKAYRKYSMPIPPALLEAMARQNSNTGTAKTGSKAKGNKNKGNAVSGGARHNGTEAATNGTGIAGAGLVAAAPEPNDTEYLSPVIIGGQTLNMDFDSGSSDLWVFNTQLDAQSTTGHKVFDPTKSKTFALMKGASFSISYGDGSGAAGNVGTDTVNIGGATVTKQAIELATAVSQSFVDDTANQGLVGLAFSKLNTVKPQRQKTFFDNVAPGLAEPVFTADLRKNAVGAYEFGRIDTTKFTGQMAWVPVNTTQGFWQFSSQTFAVNGGQPQAGTRGGQAIADTGTTLILANPKTVQGYYSQVPGAVNDAQVGGITVPCDAQLPDLMLDVGGIYMARVKGSDINFAQVQGNSTISHLLLLNVLKRFER